MTKLNILKVSRQLFYDYGIANVRLQQIADDAGISVGNLAYHYKNKEAIVEAIYHQAFIEMHKLVEQPLQYNGLSDLDKSITAIFRFNHAFGFCFNNVWEISRNYPALYEEWQTISKKILSQTLKRLSSYHSGGLLKKEFYNGMSKCLAQQLLLNFLSWIPQQRLTGKNASLQAFKTSSWALVYPYFTAKGMKAFKEIDGGF